ncbi:AbgT family transporter [Brucella pseudogrignonensis]|uniref:AbgT family transporter n=1 Tax=Brucella pseudogrignonensis TaxID=419475 RepID=UPI001EDC8C71|nr:AbgT family transporter [Brucella pseudogrignonensis]UKK94640.1 AbgT family transporter [Brucella pseudogrignonensis]
MLEPGSSKTANSIVAIACWIDLLGYGGAINEGGFDPANELSRQPLSRLYAFQRIVAKNSSGGFPTLVMNDGAVAYSNIENVRSDKAWRFIERCWNLYNEATAVDIRTGGPGLRGVIAVGLRAKGSNRGIVAQEDALTAIIDDLVAGKTSRDEAVAEVRKVRRVFDIVPQLQANFAFTRAYEAESAGSDGGFPGPNLFLDEAVFASGIPPWIRTGKQNHWHPMKAALSTSFVPILEIDGISPETARTAFRTGDQLRQILSFRGGRRTLD